MKQERFPEEGYNLKLTMGIYWILMNQPSADETIVDFVVSSNIIYFPPSGVVWPGVKLDGRRRPMFQVAPEVTPSAWGCVEL